MSWKKTTLGELADKLGGVIQTGPFGSQLHQSDYQEYGTPTIMPQNIVGDRVETSEIARVDDSIVRRLSRHILQEGDIIYPRRGDLGKRALITSREAGWLCGTGCLKVSIPEGEIIPRFLFYYFKQPKVTYWLENNAVGSTMLNLSASVLRNLPVEYPDPLTQQAIADTLSAYDDLIDNNKRRIALLEESVHLLYREWFVHLRFPGYDQVKVVDGIPEGWGIDKITRLCTVIDGTHDSPKPEESGYYLVTGKHLINGFIDFSSCYFISPEEHQKVMRRSKPEKGDIILSNIGTLGSSVLVDQDFEFSIKNVALFKPHNSIHSGFLYLYFSDEYTLEEMKQKASGTSQRFFSLKFLRGLDILIPPESTIQQFTEIADPMLKQRSLLNKSNQKLREARDRLLPRLMNGSLAV